MRGSVLNFYEQTSMDKETGDTISGLKTPYVATQLIGRAHGCGYID